MLIQILSFLYPTSYDLRCWVKEHIDQLTKRVSRKIAVIHTLRPILSSDILNIIYQTTVQLIFDYCLSVWLNSSKQNINNTQTLQNRAV